MELKCIAGPKYTTNVLLPSKGISNYRLWPKLIIYHCCFRFVYYNSDRNQSLQLINTWYSNLKEIKNWEKQRDNPFIVNAFQFQCIPGRSKLWEHAWLTNSPSPRSMFATVLVLIMSTFFSKDTFFKENKILWTLYLLLETLSLKNYCSSSALPANLDNLNTSTALSAPLPTGSLITFAPIFQIDTVV